MQYQNTVDNYSQNKLDTPFITLFTDLYIGNIDPQGEETVVR